MKVLQPCKFMPAVMLSLWDVVVFLVHAGPKQTTIVAQPRQSPWVCLSSNSLACEARATMSSGDLTLATSKRMLLCRLSTICCIATISPLPCMPRTHHQGPFCDVHKLQGAAYATGRLLSDRMAFAALFNLCLEVVWPTAHILACIIHAAKVWGCIVSACRY